MVDTGACANSKDIPDSGFVAPSVVAAGELPSYCGPALFVNESSRQNSTMLEFVGTALNRSRIVKRRCGANTIPGLRSAATSGWLEPVALMIALLNIPRGMLICTLGADPLMKAAA